MCFFCNKKTIFWYEFVFFYPKLICGPKIISVSTFVIVWRELAATTQGVDSWHIWETLPGKMCIAPSIMFVQVFLTFFFGQYVNHRIAGIMMRASWFDCDIVRNILRIAHPLDQKMDVLLSILNGQEMQEGDWIRSEGTTEGRKPFSRQRKARTRSWHEGH